MRQVQPDVWETDVEHPFPGLTTHAYLWVRPQGNVLFYNTGNHSEIERMSDLGGVAYQYLSHEDELGDSLNLIRKKFGAKLGGHIREQEAFSKVCKPDILFDQREVHFDAIDVIPTPGHTQGSTCFLVNSVDGRRYLFTGDTLYLGKGDIWTAGYIDGHSDKTALAKSLELLKTFKPDVVFSSAFIGENGFQEISAVDWPAYVDAALAALRKK